MLNFIYNIFYIIGTITIYLAMFAMAVVPLFLLATYESLWFLLLYLCIIPAIYVFIYKFI